MSLLLFANNAQTTLAGPIASSATSINLAAGTGGEFPNPTSGQYFVMTLNDQSTKLLREIIWVTARSGDTITVIRGQEGTSGQNWLANDIAANWWTAGQAQAMIQVAQLQIQATNFAMDTGSANNLNITLVPPPSSLVSIKGSAVRLVVANTNTGSSSLNINALGATTISNPDGSGLAQGQLIAGHVYEFSFNGSTFDLLSSPYQLIKQANTWSGLQTFTNGILVPNNQSLLSKDTSGNTRATVNLGSDNILHIQSGPAGLAVANAAGTANAIQVDTIGNWTSEGGYITGGYDPFGYSVRFTSGQATSSGWRIDATNTYFLIGPTGSGFGGLRPFTVSHAGLVTIDQTGVGVGTGGSLGVGGNLTVTGTASATIYASSESFVSDGFDSFGLNFRAVGGAYNVGIRNDGTSTYLLTTSAGGTSFNGLRPFSFNNGTGAVIIDGTGAGTTFGGSVEVAGSVISNSGVVQGISVQSNGGPVTANGNRLRASFGASNSGDPNAATILNDFGFTALEFTMPTGMIVQYFTQGFPGNSSPTPYSFPTPFPNSCVFVICSFMASLPPANGACGVELRDRFTYTGTNTGVGGNNGCNVLAIGF